MKTSIQSKFSNEIIGLPKDLLNALIIAADKAKVQRIALVGGIVRDQFIRISLNQVIHNINDIDLVIEGSITKLTREIIKHLGEKRVIINRLNPSYKTVEIRVDNIRIDIARARLEKYFKPGENPTIINSKIEEDLYRRDFTVNSIALDLRSRKLIDPLNGQRSILNQKLEFNHRKSVEEDPTRIIRAARYSARLNFELSEESINQIQSTLKVWPWEKSSTNSNKNKPNALSSRLRMELDLLFSKEDWEKCIKNLQEWGALILLDLNLQDNKDLNKRLKLSAKLGVNPLNILIASSSNPYKLGLRLYLSKKEQININESISICEKYSSNKFKEKSKSWDIIQWCNAIESSNWQEDSIALAICLEANCWQVLLNWWSKWRFVKSSITAKDLLKKGWKEGEEIGKELKRLREIELKKIEEV